MVGLTFDENQRLEAFRVRDDLTEDERQERDRLQARGDAERQTYHAPEPAADERPKTDAVRLAELRAKKPSPNRPDPNVRTDEEEDELARLEAAEREANAVRTQEHADRLEELRAKPDRTIDEEDEMRRLARVVAA